MNDNLLSLAHTALGGDFPKLAGQFLGESTETTQSALNSLLPVVLGTLANKGATQQGASGLMSLISGANLDTSSLGNLAGLFGNGGAGLNALLKTGTNTLVPALFRDKGGAVVQALAGSSGIKGSSATNMLAMIVPLVLMLLKNFIGDKGLNAASLSSLFKTQAPNLRGALDSRMTSALGFSNPAAFLSGLGGQAADAGVRAGAAVTGGAARLAAGTSAAAVTATTTSRAGLMRWLPWLIGAAVLLLLWNLFSGKSAPPPAAGLSAPAAQPAIPALGLPAKVYFAVGASTIGAEGSSTIAAAADAINKGGLKVTLTGYTDKTGDPSCPRRASR